MYLSPSLRVMRSATLQPLCRFACLPPSKFILNNKQSISKRLSFLGYERQRHRCVVGHKWIQVSAMGEDSFEMDCFDNWDDNEGTSLGNSYLWSSSEGEEESDTELLINPSGDVDLPRKRVRWLGPDSALTTTAHRVATLQSGGGKNRYAIVLISASNAYGDFFLGKNLRGVDNGLALSKMTCWDNRCHVFGCGTGVLINIGLLVSLLLFLLVVDSCAWRIIRIPLEPFLLTYPFCISAVLATCLGFVCVPLLRSFKIHQILRKEGQAMHFIKKGTPTVGGLFFISVGVIVTRTVAGFSSVEVFGATTATLAFAAIGLLDDLLIHCKGQNYRLRAGLKLVLQVAVGAGFSFWFDSTNILSPYGMKMLVPLPPPLGLIYLGKTYLIFSVFCFVAMSNGVSLTDGLDGLAGGAAAFAFVALSVAILPLCSDLSIFGASMAGACMGFLMHNRHKASCFMGDTGSLALGGGLAAMAACTGMFFPLFISSGIFVIEVSSVMAQNAVSVLFSIGNVQGGKARGVIWDLFQPHMW
ncbi:phospho-N-acetylmuramoyl-pentapeptide-transferase homolog isoform X2 [Amborella trichopoda]|uniref:phospho-N-acetylmuramoyl-pentapeptide- transferase homolog isoform X2 n=1 Tax=Amborella trichopoda TaxID=13333 RepID=UPI0009C181B4|nr:phospho-N-acetylmuramoyl-pentapeptide-transferase homolog isoform X2 [Amborella trichopoda]|eukprot:XP_020523484.1 phospho-N-acetylmuramoyl-pentapeptide-transferase homolog isoform X2 [Amborella trichopoda]